MFTGNHITTSFKEELLLGVHNFTTDTFKLALYTNEALLNSTATTYSADNEVSGAGYTAGGADLVLQSTTSEATTAFANFEPVNWVSATLTARGGLIYNSTAVGNPAVAVLDFGSDKVVNNSTFTVSFPTATADTAIIRIR